MLGQLPTFQPIDASESSSLPPQVLSPPPQALAIASANLPLALVIAALVFVSVRQSVTSGSLPATTLPLHLASALVRAWTYCDDDFVIVALHFRGSAWPGVGVPTVSRPSVSMP